VFIEIQRFAEFQGFGNLSSIGQCIACSPTHNAQYVTRIAAVLGIISLRRWISAASLAKR
jgi:hypothetical protein